MTALRWAALTTGQRLVCILVWVWAFVLAWTVAAFVAGLVARLSVWAFRLGWGA